MNGDPAVAFQSVKWGLFGVMVFGVVLTLLFPDARVRRRGSSFFLSWFAPGLGHALLGRWRKGLFFFSILTATYLFGLWICGFRTVAFEDNPFYYVGQYGCGVVMLCDHLLGAVRAFPRPDLPLSWYDPGLLYVCVVGLLNIVVMLNVLEVRLPSKPGTPPTPKVEGA